MHYQIGYRMKSDVMAVGMYSAPYFEFSVVYTRDHALAIERKMARDFPAAEFRVIKCHTSRR